MTFLGPRDAAGDRPPTAPPPPRAASPVEDAVRAGRPLVLHVVVPLCSNQQINCGSSVAGRADDLNHNLYWGAAFGARRFFERKNSGWTMVEVTHPGGVVLERAIFRRMAQGNPWNTSGPVEEIVALEAIHGDAIDAAIDHLWHLATEGGRLRFQDGGKTRTESITVVGYAGHNRLMDGKALPLAPARPAPIPSFVLACASEPYFGRALSAAGSTPLVMTTTLMAPEGYLIEAIARGLGENLSASQLRARAVLAYATWQKLTPQQAGAIFAKR